MKLFQKYARLRTEKLELAGTEVTATAAEINQAADVSGMFEVVTAVNVIAPTRNPRLTVRMGPPPDLCSVYSPRLWMGTGLDEAPHFQPE